MMSEKVLKLNKVRMTEVKDVDSLFPTMSFLNLAKNALVAV